MPIDFSIEHDKRYVVVSYRGVVRDADFVLYWRDFLRAEGWIPGYGQLADLSNADFSQASKDGVQQLAAFIESVYARLDDGERADRTAVYAPGDLTFGFARMWAALVAGTPQEVAVFRDLDEAKSWLGEE